MFRLLMIYFLIFSRSCRLPLTRQGNQDPVSLQPRSHKKSRKIEPAHTGLKDTPGILGRINALSVVVDFRGEKFDLSDSRVRLQGLVW